MKSTTEELGIDQRLIRALSHPLRQKILVALNRTTASPSQISRQLGEPLGNVSYHVKILADLDAIELVQTRPVRGAVEHIYRATMRPYFDDEHWSRLPTSAQKALLDHSLQEIWEHTVAAAESDGFDHPRTHVSWTRLRLDEQAHQELAAAAGELLERALELEAESVSRLAEVSAEEPEEHETELVVLHFHRPRGPERAGGDDNGRPARRPGR
jgi:DNA-binding transcriptional ArsR family regulator